MQARKTQAIMKIAGKKRETDASTVIGLGSFLAIHNIDGLHFTIETAYAALRTSTKERSIRQ